MEEEEAQPAKRCRKRAQRATNNAPDEVGSPGAQPVAERPVDEITFVGDHGLKVTMSKDMFKKVKISREEGYYSIKIKTEKFEEVVDFE